MKSKVRSQLDKRKRQIDQRIDKKNWNGRSPMVRPPAIQYELSEKHQAIAAGGLGVIQQMVKQLGVDRAVNEAIPLLKLHLPYSEADHVLNIAYNLLAGGTCLEHLELRRTDEAYLNALGAQRIPDPTTAGDFCRRFERWNIFVLMEKLNEVRSRVWQQQPDEFFERAIIEADGTMVETTGQCKEGMGMNYKRQWGYHPLLVTLANTREPLYVVNRSGNRPSYEQAPLYFDRAIGLCREAGFRKVLLRGDTDFALTQQFDRWTAADVQFVFGIDAMPSLVKTADSLDETAWRPLRRRRAPKPRTARRRRPKNVKRQIVIEKEYQNKRLEGEFIAEFDYQPMACSRSYRVVAVRKQVAVTAGQQKLFNDTPYLFYISNIPRHECSDRQVVFHANDRCDQENIISQLHSMGAFAAPLDNLISNWAYMVIATLAWSLKCWSGLLVVRDAEEPERCETARRRILRMDFSTYRQSLIQIPAQIIRRGRRLIYRLLSYSDYVWALLTIHDAATRPLRC